MRTPSFAIALFLLACHFLSLPVTLASPVAQLEVLLPRQQCINPAGGCRFSSHDAPAVADPFELSSSSQAAPTSSTEPQLGAVVTSSSGSASGSSPTPTAGSSSSKSNAGVALVSQGKLFSAAFAVLVATVLVS